VQLNTQCNKETNKENSMAITAAAVKSLRERTGLPMMDCKKALQETDGNEDAAIQYLKEKGDKKFEERQSRETAFGRVGIYTSLEPGVGAMVELKCESAPMTKQEDFIHPGRGPRQTTGDPAPEPPPPRNCWLSLRPANPARPWPTCGTKPSTGCGKSSTSAG
jgi:hypothetical protein